MARKSSRVKRNLVRTPAPRPQPVPQQSAPPRPMFVVQEHHASRLHYDFRLEAEGVLKSWAIPKGPSIDPTQKRLAVQVEDHPLAYATFTGTIPQGQYGAGTVTIWDQGTYDHVLAEKPVPQTVPEGIAAGHLEFALHGKKLQGQFVLVRMHRPERGQAQWLLIKRQDAFARSEDHAGVTVPEHGRTTAGQAQARPPQARRRACQPTPNAPPSRRRTGLPPRTLRS
jgi:bifunctional non-homologous end joining protein LigD